MNDKSKTTTQPASTIPSDDLHRHLALARPDADLCLPHLGLVGDTYTILLTGKDTAGRYCLIDMHIPPGGGPPPHRHDFEESFIVIAGELEATFRGAKSVYEPVKPSTSRPMRRTSFTMRAGCQFGCYASAPHPGRKNFSWPSAFPWRTGQRRPLRSTLPRRLRSKRNPKHSPRNTARSCWRTLSLQLTNP